MESSLSQEPSSQSCGVQLWCCRSPAVRLPTPRGCLCWKWFSFRQNSMRILFPSRGLRWKRLSFRLRPVRLWVPAPNLYRQPQSVQEVTRQVASPFPQLNWILTRSQCESQLSGSVCASNKEITLSPACQPLLQSYQPTLFQCSDNKEILCGLNLCEKHQFIVKCWNKYQIVLTALNLSREMLVFFVSVLLQDFMFFILFQCLFVYVWVNNIIKNLWSLES